MQDGFRSLCEEIYEILCTEDQGKAIIKVELGKLDLIFKVTKTIQNGFRSICEKIFDVSSPNLVHRSNRARQKKVALSYSGGVTPTVAIKRA